MSNPTKASFHLINYPSEAKSASVFCGTTNGTVFISSIVGGDTRETETRPLSPAYNINNPATARHLTLPLGTNNGKSEVVAVTIVNDSKEESTVSVAVGISVLPEANQSKLFLTRTVDARSSAFFHIVFNQV